MSQPPDSAIRANILVVDDTKANLKLLSGMLTQHGHKVRSVLNGKTAITAAHASPPDLILLDINMPDMNGYEVCQSLKAHAQTRGIPIIFISALDEVFDKVKAFESGGVDYITKPFHLEEVLARVQNQLTISSLQAQLEHRLHELQRLTSRLQHEMVLAHDIQQRLLPAPVPGWEALDVLCYNAPAREVGGDLYAYHCQTAHSFAVAVGDVSGKGMPAALLMAVCEALLRSCLPQAFTPAGLLAHMDTALLDYTRPTRQNCALVYLDITLPAPMTDSHTAAEDVAHAPCVLRAANAGGIQPLVRYADGRVEWLDAGGLPLGIGMGITPVYPEVQRELNKGDAVILMSDGVVEAKNLAGDLFGFERLEQTIATAPPADAAELLAHLQFELFRFMENAEPQDDITIVVVQL